MVFDSTRFGILPRVVKNLAIMQPIFGLFGEVGIFESLLRHTFYENAECPHDFAMTDDDHSFVATLPMEC